MRAQDVEDSYVSADISVIILTADTFPNLICGAGSFYL